MKWAGRTILPAAAALMCAASDAARANDKNADFADKCIAALQKEGRPRDTAYAACDCVAKRTEGRPELQEEFLSQIGAGKAGGQKSSPALRQVRSACVPMPIWGLTSAEE